LLFELELELELLLLLLLELPELELPPSPPPAGGVTPPGAILCSSFTIEGFSGFTVSPFFFGWFVSFYCLATFFVWHFRRTPARQNRKPCAHAPLSVRG